jgi:hypothetical protein
LISGSLNPQEVSVAIQSIRTSIEVRDVAGDHLFVPASEMPFGEMNSVRELDHLTQEVRTRAETLEDAGDLLPPGTGAPEIIGSSSVTGSVGVFDDSDFCYGRCGLRLGVRDLGLIVFVFVFLRHVEDSVSVKPVLSSWSATARRNNPSFAIA